MLSNRMQLKNNATGDITGSFTLDALRTMAAKGQIAIDDHVRPVGSPVWLKVTEVARLAEAIPVKQASEPDWESLGEPPRPRRPRQRHVAEAVIDMAPMIDVTFLLLIFFMLTNSMANPTAMPVPEAVYGRGVSLDGQQLIIIDREGRYYLGDTPTKKNRVESLSALVAVVEKNVHANTTSLEVVINAHRDDKHFHVRQLLEGLGRIEGLGRVRLGVEEKIH